MQPVIVGAAAAHTAVIQTTNERVVSGTAHHRDRR
jgi:hypothetical protein